MTFQEQPGFYGKIPAIGDFISRRLPSEFILPWDSWLQTSQTASRQALGERWLNIYLTSPIWRFILSPNNCGPTGWMGILMPSVDRVGRYFPLTLATPIQRNNDLASLFFSAAGWFDRLELLALSSLEDEFNLDSFDERLKKELVITLLNPDPPHDTGSDNSGEGNLAMHIEMETLDKLPEAMIALGSSLCARLLPTYSLWCTNGSDRVHPCLLAYQGLPPGVAFTEFISGEWRSPVHHKLSQMPITTSGLSSAATDISPKDSPLRPRNCWQWHSTAVTSVGRVRKINEDSYFDSPNEGIWAVADGMGGHWAGEVASKAVVDALSTIPAVQDIDSSLSSVAACLRAVNAKLISMAEEGEAGRSMGSTVVAMLATRGNMGAAVWVGDSRLYRLRGEIFTQLTQDHSLAAEMARHGSLLGFEGEGAVNSNIITRAVGAQQTLVVDDITFEVERNDVYLLCSDGLIREVKDDEICGILRWHVKHECAQALVDLALERGAKDNVTVIVVWPEPEGISCVS